MSALPSLSEMLIAREGERRDDLVAGDRAALAELLTDDLVHVHTSGQVHDKARLLDHVTGFLQFLDVRRGPLLIRPLSTDAAVMTGTMTNIVKRRGTDELVEVDAFVTQLWIRHADVWRIASFHAVCLA